MTNLIKKEQIGINEIAAYGKYFVESNYFSDSKSIAQAIVKIQAGQEIGLEPFAAMSGIHIINGKPTLGAGIMASKVKASGKYDYKVRDLTEQKCIIEFFQGKEAIGKSIFTLDDARKAGTKNLQKYARNMLFARALSNGVKWYCPDVFLSPVYVPEEMGAEPEREPAEIIIEAEPVEEPAPVVEESPKQEKKQGPQPPKTFEEMKAKAIKYLSGASDPIEQEERFNAMLDGAGKLNPAWKKQLLQDKEFTSLVLAAN